MKTTSRATFDQEAEAAEAVCSLQRPHEPSRHAAAEVASAGVVSAEYSALHSNQSLFRPRLQPTVTVAFL